MKIVKRPKQILKYQITKNTITEKNMYMQKQHVTHSRKGHVMPGKKWQEPRSHLELLILSSLFVQEQCEKQSNGGIETTQQTQVPYSWGIGKPNTGKCFMSKLS